LFCGKIYVLFNTWNIIHRRTKNDITWNIFNKNSDSLLEHVKAEVVMWKKILKALVKKWVILCHKWWMMLVEFSIMQILMFKLRRHSAMVQTVSSPLLNAEACFRS
jgi:hypothetical protein